MVDPHKSSRGHEVLRDVEFDLHPTSLSHCPKGDRRDSLSNATRHKITQHSRNRVAPTLVLVFIPVWPLLVNVIIPSEPIDVHSRPAGRATSVDANELGMTSGAMNAVTPLIDFVTFTAVRRSADFDRRLVPTGFPRSALLPATLLGAAGVVALYASLALAAVPAPGAVRPAADEPVRQRPDPRRHRIVLAMVFHTEPAGMFMIILVDVMVQTRSSPRHRQAAESPSSRPSEPCKPPSPRRSPRT
ncbi:hypothetical protein L6E12_16380 [Actinokineospora sp. PR83]|uniref:hypothetical protein n=1 Tax=Actinokineospora sp. PR83 TaxID=2884908 RepID=UPI001F335B1B|nr:hypothetical protein [Actinokineospora sp. PR83]MCG8917364.1 hypothetical protein [Actinokineospora sp. PR83]